ncbi:E3 ubiquitin-protein ligase TRIM22 [Patella vulgata]|uniref:E3 ubiquitin-protein ligase TRIM22 n=1 Tax=Patella vulgata TaxID=6465 RepID=UPI0024A9FDF1|nr:E3 ubiquitin-protein ligase TRIM22 [Patella vulgata]
MNEAYQFIDMAEKINKNDCSICLNYFTKPKIIDCHHTFCTSCLDDYVKRTAKKNLFRCPLCTRSIKIPDGGVNDFPVNFYIDDKPVPVSVCRQHKKEKDLYCKDCKITLCYKCFITSHQGHNLQNVEDVENEHKLILEELEQKVQIKMALNKSIVESLKKEVLTINQFSTAECEKVDQRIEAMIHILKDEGRKIKLKVQNPNLKQAQVMSDMTKDVEENTRQMSEFGKQIREVLNRSQLEEILNTTPKVRQAINDADKDFAVPNYECPRFQNGVVDVEHLSKQIGNVHVPVENQFECSFDVSCHDEYNSVYGVFGNQFQNEVVYVEHLSKQIGNVHVPVENQFECSFEESCDDEYNSVYEVLGNQDQMSQCYTIQGVAWALDCVLRNKNNTSTALFVDDGYVKLQLKSSNVKCRASFKLKIININDSKSLIIEDDCNFRNNTSWADYKQGNYKKQARSGFGFYGSMQDYANRKKVRAKSCVSMADSYVWDQLSSDYILNPRNGFIDINKQITIQVVFSSIDCED